VEWSIYFYTDQKGEQPVVEFLAELPVKDRVKAAWIINLLQTTGTNLREPYAKYLTEGIWELRPQQIRILYFLVDDTFILIHAFKKKTQKTPPAEIETAVKRMLEYQEGSKEA
jgi:phage-related protein